ncbi:MAG: hypothetical protein QM697_13530 [Lachnospiraceae bacterium]
MNRKIGMFAAAVNVMAVTGFALTMAAGSDFGGYLASVFIALGFVPMMCSFCLLAKQKTKLAGYLSMGYAAIYATIILLVYFAQCTTVHRGGLSEEAMDILDYRRFGLFFNYDLLGYAMMSLSTFFAGLTIDGKTRGDRWLKALLLIHGIFFITCLLIPMLDVFSADRSSSAWIGTAVLEFWCIYFIPIGILSFQYFRKQGSSCEKKITVDIS